MRLTYTHNGEPLELDAALEGDTLRVRLPDGNDKTVAARRLPGGGVELRDGDRVFRVTTARDRRGGVSASWDGTGYVFDSAVAGKGSGRKGATSGVIVAPMVGTVAAVHVEPGQKVSAYQPLVVVEAMKVLATLEAPFAGTVRAVPVVKGQAVQQGATLVEVEPEAGQAEDGK